MSSAIWSCSAVFEWYHWEVCTFPKGNGKAMGLGERGSVEDWEWGREWKLWSGCTVWEKNKKGESPSRQINMPAAGMSDQSRKLSNHILKWSTKQKEHTGSRMMLYNLKTCHPCYTSSSKAVLPKHPQIVLPTENQHVNVVRISLP